MLKTLENYIADEPPQDWLLEPVWRQIGRDRRITQIFTTSAICHIIFYLSIIWWNSWAMRQQTPMQGRQPELVKIAELAPPPDKVPPLRSRAEAIERADTTKFQYDPDNSNDVNLTNRSPKPTTARGLDTKLPSASQLEKQAKAASGAGNADKPSPANAAPRPPETAPVSAARPPQTDTSVAAQGVPTQTVPAPPAPAAAKPATNNSPNNAATTAQAGRPQGNGEETATFALERARAQYYAYVRSKIIKINERILPKDFIESVLANTVSAEFEIVVGRGGQLLSTTLTRSSGYKQLDARAREAIQLAKPFEGYPPNAGDTIPIKVTIYYTPGR